MRHHHQKRAVVRDVDILTDMARLNLVHVHLSITTLDADLVATLQPRTSRPAARLEAIRRLTAAGVPTGVMVAPVIPGLNDHEMPGILEAAAAAGAKRELRTVAAATCGESDLRRLAGHESARGTSGSKPGFARCAADRCTSRISKSASAAEAITPSRSPRRSKFSETSTAWLADCRP